jgi:hypothetical protein
MRPLQSPRVDMDAFKDLERRFRCSDCGERAMAASAAADPLNDLAGAAAIGAGLLIDLARTFAGPTDVFAGARSAGRRFVARMHLRLVGFFVRI